MQHIIQETPRRQLPRGTCDHHFSPAAIFGPLGPVAEPTRPGPQPVNRIAASYAGAIARAAKPRNPSADLLVTRGQLRRVVGRRVQAVTAEVAVLIARVEVLERRLAGGDR